MRFWRQVFSEEDGSPSFSRVATAFMVSTAIGVIVYVVVKKSALPGLSEMTGLATFVSCLYASNKVSEKASAIITAFKGTPPPVASTTTAPVTSTGAGTAKD